MRKDILLWALFSFTGIAIVLSFVNIGSKKKSSEELSAIKTTATSLSFNERKGPLYLEILSPIYYFEGGYVNSSGVKKWVNIIDNARKNAKVTGLLLRINSPGGSVGASQELYEALKRFREAGKPIVTSVIDICASGAYYAALPSDAIIANYGALIGSIGVRITGADFTGLYEKLGIGFNTIKSGEYKDILSPARKLKESEKKHLQNLVDFSYNVFLNDVLKWRGDNDKKREQRISNAANGLIYNTEDAMNIGLIDGQGDLIAAEKKMAEILKIPHEELYFRSPTRNFLENLGNQIPLLQSFTSWLNHVSSKSQTILEYRH